MIVVMTNGNAWQDAAAGESPKGFVAPSMRPDERAKVAEGAFELSFPEIVKFVEKNFRTLANKKNRAIAGLSWVVSTLAIFPSITRTCSTM